MQKQNEEDLDTEIANSISKYEKKLRVEKDEGARLKGENGIMRKKFNTLNKDIEDNKNEITRMKDDEKKLQSTISTLEKDIIGLKKEVKDKGMRSKHQLSSFFVDIDGRTRRINSRQGAKGL